MTKKSNGWLSVGTRIDEITGKQMEQFDNVTKLKHYQGFHGLEAIEVHKNFLTVEELRGFYKGNALKYMLRERNKNGLEDLKKARQNLDWLIDELEETS